MTESTTQRPPTIKPEATMRPEAEIKPEAMMRPVRALRLGRFSRVWRPRLLVVVGLLALGCFLAACLSTTTGSFPISLVDVISTVLGGGSERQRLIVIDTRLPRAVLGLVIGAALGISGAIVQAVARNGLASPDILGVNAGAGFVAVGALTGAGGVIGAAVGQVGLTIASLVGGLATGAAVYLLAHRRGITTQRLILTGIALSAMLTAGTEWMLLRVDLMRLSSARTWLYGYLGSATWGELTMVAGAVAVLCVAALSCARALPVLHLGDDTAQALGLPLVATRVGLLVIAVLLVGVSTAAAGPIPFVAFVAPHVATRLTRVPTPPLVASAFAGAVLLVLADWLARVVVPAGLPVGVLTAAVGGPFMMYLLLRSNRLATT